MIYPQNFHTEVASSYHTTSNHKTYENFQLKQSHILGLVTNFFCFHLNSAFSYISQHRLNTKYSEQCRRTARSWLNTMKAQDKIAEHCMFAIGHEWRMIW